MSDEYLASWERIQRDTYVDGEELRSAVVDHLEAQPGCTGEGVSSGYAPAAISLLTEHCDLMPGFGLLMPLPIGVAVALRRAGDALPNGRDSEETVFRLDPEQVPGSRQPWCGVMSRALSDVTSARPPALDVVVKCSQSQPMSVSCVASTLLAFCRALEEGGYIERIDQKVLKACHAALVSELGFPVNVASILGAHAVETEKLVLVDTHAFEGVTLDLPDRKRIGWGLVQLGRIDAAPVDVLADRREKVEQALAILRRRWPLESLRDLEHRDLDAALGLLPARLGRVVKYAVSENSRVQKTVVAIRNSDWQFVGALLLMSHAALRDELGLGSTQTDFVVSESHQVEGVYGARRVGRSFFGNVLCMGQSFSVLKFLDRIEAATDHRFGTEAHAVLL